MYIQKLISTYLIHLSFFYSAEKYFQRENKLLDRFLDGINKVLIAFYLEKRKSYLKCV